MPARILTIAALLSIASAPGLAQNMALTPRREPAPAEPPPQPPRPVAHLVGDLPNQKTGPARPQRVVRDICVGCDR